MGIDVMSAFADMRAGASLLWRLGKAIFVACGRQLMHMERKAMIAFVFLLASICPCERDNVSH
jgi:hypothetical protein